MIAHSGEITSIVRTDPFIPFSHRLCFIRWQPAGAVPGLGAASVSVHALASVWVWVWELGSVWPWGLALQLQSALDLDWQSVWMLEKEYQ